MSKFIVEAKPDDNTEFEIPDDLWELLQYRLLLAPNHRGGVESFLKTILSPESFERIKITPHYKFDNQSGMKIAGIITNESEAIK